MRKLLLIAVFTLCLFSLTTKAEAIGVPLAPGANVLSLGDSFDASGTIVASLIDLPVSGVNASNVEFYRGFLSQWVYDIANTGLLFVYQVHNDPAPLHADHIQTLSTTDFSGFDTTVDINGLAGKTISRGSSGSTVTFNFLDIADNTTSPYYWIQTNAKYLTWGGTNLIDGGTANLRTYAPSAVPEPGSMLLLGMGILGLFGLGRKKA